MRSLALAGLAAAATAQFTLYKVDPAAKGGVCLDGTPGAFYFKPGVGANASKFMLHFEGGGWCYDAGDCAGRAQGNLGSSKAYPATEATVSGGIMSQDCALNPTFCTWSFVYLKYCDGDSFSGARPDVLPFNGVDLHMRGHFILQSVMDSLSANVMKAVVPFSSATDVVLSGCSAGGLATFLHTQYFADTYIAAGVNFWSIPVSGFFLDAPNVLGERVYTNQMQTVWEMQQPGATGVNAACVAANKGFEWRCNMAEYVYQFITASIFPLNSAYDSWQLPCIMTAVDVPGTNTTQNGDCDAVVGWTDCGKNPELCTLDQMLAVNTYRTEFIAKMNETATAQKASNGAFIVSCSTHCEALGGGWATFSVNGVTMRTAVDEWMQGVKPQVQKNFYWDCQLDEQKTPRKCNPTC